MNLAPSRKTILLGITCILVLGAIFYFSKKTPPTTYSLDSRGLSQGAEFFVEDSDGDGVPDWEEILWGTDPSNPDTEGTGIGDLELINRIKIENEKNTPLFQTRTSAGGGSANNTKTDLISQQLLKELLNLKQTTGADNKSLEDLANRTLNEINSIPGAGNLYQAKDITISNERATPDSVMNYTNALIGVLKKHSTPPNSINISQIAELSDPRFISWSKSMSEYFLRIARDVVTVPTNSDFASFHLVLSNNFAKIGLEFETISSSAEDTISVLSATQRIDELHNNINYLFAYLEYYLSLNGIILSENLGIYIKRQ